LSPDRMSKPFARRFFRRSRGLQRRRPTRSGRAPPSPLGHSTALRTWWGLGCYRSLPPPPLPTSGSTTC
jgi:hypothetical protein